jgi:hypothetical protein
MGTNDQDAAGLSEALQQVVEFDDATRRGWRQLCSGRQGSTGEQRD